MHRCIYGLVRKGDSRVRYVGFTTVGIEARFQTHLYNANKLRKGAVYDWLRKYPDDVEVVLLEHCGDESTLSELRLREKWWIADLKTMLEHGGLNMTDGGTGGSVKGKPKSAECRAAQSLYHQTEEGKARAEARGKKSWEVEGRRERHALRMGTPEMKLKISKGPHMRWHVARQLSKPDCVWCLDHVNTESGPAGGGPS